LPGSDYIGEEIKRFRKAVLEQSGEAQELGARLYESLFGQLTAPELAKASWLLSLDGGFFELPFAALREVHPAREPAYLIERHALQIVPGAFLLGKQAAREAAVARKTSDEITYVGFGDPVYNTADPRFQGLPWYQRPWYGLLASSTLAGQLNRLVASGEEVERSAQAWQESRGTEANAQVFEGSGATLEAFRNVLNGRRGSTIHLATHVLTGSIQQEQAFLAFSMGPAGGPQLLATSDVARLKVPGSLVVMTGCASGTGDVVAGAGILGLTRAWLAAGATEVMATAWAVEDVRSDLLPSFYRHLRRNTAAEALRRSQVDMLHSGNWQADPVFWASYQLTGVAR